MKRTKLIILLIFFGFNLSAQNYETLYKDAFDQIRCMLEGSCPLSFKKAVFATENAYLGGVLDTMAIQQEIKILAGLANTISRTKTLKYDEKDSLKVKKYAALFSVMTDTIPMILGDGELYEYRPFTYDFEDIWGAKSWKKMFVSKLLETGKGNCHSLPYLYKILAEEIEVEAHLALAPNHMYIKHKNLKDGWYNTELTSGIFPMDAWLMASGYIHLDAISNKLYMEALNDKQSIAMCMIDLAEGYNRIFPENDGTFVARACKTALSYYPNYVNGKILLVETNKRIFEHQANEKYGGLKPEISKDKVLNEMFMDLQKDYAAIHHLGYRRMPKEMYVKWLISLNEQKAKFENKTLNK